MNLLQIHTLKAQADNTANAPIYAFVKALDNAQDQVVISYYLYYPYNVGKSFRQVLSSDKIKYAQIIAGILSPQFISYFVEAHYTSNHIIVGSHVSDLEHVTVRAQRTTKDGPYKFVNVYLSQHSAGGETTDPEVWDDLQNNGIYVDQGGHGIYDSAGPHKYLDNNWINLADQADGKAKKYNLHQYIMLQAVYLLG